MEAQVCDEQMLAAVAAHGVAARPRYTDHDYACALKRAIHSVTLQCQRLEQACPDDPYVALMLFEDTEVLQELVQRLRGLAEQQPPAVLHRAPPASHQPSAQPSAQPPSAVPSTVELQRLGEFRAALKAIASLGGRAQELAKRGLARDDYLQYKTGDPPSELVVQPLWPAAASEGAAQAFFHVGDKVTFVNAGGVVYPGKTISGIDATGKSPRYYIEPTDTPWVGVEPRYLRPASGVWAESFPRSCPITRRPYVMSVRHPELGLVPLYGGPLDLYTIPHRTEGPALGRPHEYELASYHFNLDTGGWVGTVPVALRIVENEVLGELLAPQDVATTAEAPERTQRLRQGCPFTLPRHLERARMA